MGMNVRFNPGMLEASIMNHAKTASKNASSEMRRCVIKIRDLARAYAPEKTGALERAIDYSTSKGANRRNVFVVYVDLDAMNPGPAGHQVGDYAYIMEEELHPFGRQRGRLRYTLGPRSQAKAAGGKKVGGRFLSRAIKEGTQDLVQRMAAQVTRTLSGKRIANVRFERDPGDYDE